MDDGLVYRNLGNTGLLDMLPPIPGRVLDCGCGPGDNAGILQRRGWKVTGITIDPREAEAAAAYCERVVLADLEVGISDEVGAGFDAIVMSHVLEHLRTPEVLLAQAAALLSSEGVLAVALPNVLHYRPRLGFLRGSFAYTETGVLDRTHLRFYTVSTARALLEQNDLEIVRSRVEGGLPWMKLRSLVPATTQHRINEWALRRWPDLFGVQGLFIARPTSPATHVS